MGIYILLLKQLTMSSENDAKKAKLDDDALQITIKCQCEKIEIRAVGKPIYQCFCHCDSCKLCSDAPFMAMGGYKREKVTIVSGAELIGDIVPQGSAIPRKHCTSCYTMIGDAVVKQGLFGISLALVYPRGKIPEHAKPLYHVMYSERILDFPDGVPKWVKTRAGGKGEMYPKEI